MAPGKSVEWVRQSQGVNADCKVLRCTCPTCSFMIVLKRAKKDEQTLKFWRVSSKSFYAHDAWCDSPAVGKFKEYAKDPRVQALFMRKNVSHRHIQEFIKQEYGVGVLPSFITSLKDAVRAQVEAEDEEDNAMLVPMMQDVVMRNRDACAKLRAGGNDVLITWATVATQSNRDLLRGLHEKKLEIAAIALPWTKALVEDEVGPPVLAVDAAHTAVGTRISVVSARVFNTNMPLVVAVHKAEDAATILWLLKFAREAVPGLFTRQRTSIISDRGKAVIKALDEFAAFMRNNHGTNLQVLYCKAHIFRNVIANFPELRKIAFNTLKHLIKGCLFAVSEFAFDRALKLLDEAHAQVSKKKKKKNQGSDVPTVPLAPEAGSDSDSSGEETAEGEVNDDAGDEVDGREATLETARAVGDGFHVAEAGKDADDVDGDSRLFALPAESGDDSEALLDDEAEQLKGVQKVWKHPSDYIKALPLHRFMVHKLDCTDFGVHTSNSAEGTFSWMLREHLREGNILRTFMGILKSGPVFIDRSRKKLLRLQAEKVRFAAFYPSAHLSGKYARQGDYIHLYCAEDVTENSCTVRHNLARRLGLHNVSWSAATPNAAPAQNPNVHWSLTPTSWGGSKRVLCDGSCLRPQREGFACIHVVRAAQEIEVAQEKKAFIESCFAPFYQVEYLLSKIKARGGYAVTHPSVMNLQLGPKLRALSRRKLAVHWDAQNGGRPESQEEELAFPVTEEDLDAIIAEARGPRIPSNGEIVPPPRLPGQRICGCCGLAGHYRKTCPQEAGSTSSVAAVAGDEVAMCASEVVQLEEQVKLKRAQLAVRIAEQKKARAAND